MISTIISKDNLPNQLDFDSGFLLLVDKPLEWTSFDAVNKIRFSCKHKLQKKKYKVGHAGTLDPLASGLLLICCGKYTKLIESLQNQDKAYEFRMKLGFRTETYDAESEEIFVSDPANIQENDVVNAMTAFTGDILQKPPIYSAIKIKGEALYKLARRGQNVEIKARPVHVSKLEVLNFDNPFTDVHMVCSKGTYVRSIAHDLGEALKCGAYVKSLIRTEVGQYSVNEALTIQECVEFINKVEVLSVND